MFKYRIETAEYQRLPQTPCTAVPVGERMDKLKMEHARAYEQEEME